MKYIVKSLVDKEHITLSGHNMAAISLSKKDESHKFESELEYQPYAHAIVGLIHSKKVSLEKIEEKNKEAKSIEPKNNINAAPHSEVAKVEDSVIAEAKPITKSKK